MQTGRESKALVKMTLLFYPLRCHPVPALAALGTMALLCAGCPAAAEDVEPPSDQFLFPSGIAVSPDVTESVLFVANANSELLKSSGSLLAVDLAEVDRVAGEWLSAGAEPEGCDPDPDFRDILQCRESAFITSGVRIGNFSTDVAVQKITSEEEGETLRVLVAVRGDPSVTWVRYAGGALSCDDSESTFPICDGESRLLYLRDDVDLDGVEGEPIGLYVDSEREFALATHMSRAAVSLISLPAQGKPVVADELSGLFASDGTTQSALGVAGRPRTQDSDPNIVYVTSRSDSRVWMMSVSPPSDTLPYPLLVPSQYFFLRGVIASSDARGIAFSGDGSRAYIVNRLPPALHIYDTSLADTGFPKNDFVNAVELCRESANLVVSELADTGGIRQERVYTSCFSSGQVWAINPLAARVESVINVGRGPHAMALSRARKRLYVANFLENSIAVIDIDPSSPTVNRVVMRLVTSGDDD